MGLLYWLYLLSIGIGLFNLVPIGPIDGGQMSREIFRQIFKKEETALKVWGWTSTFFFFIIIFSIFSGFF
jgi:membrane-associated protease RseP (regulator of RpoE activity)